MERNVFYAPVNIGQKIYVRHENDYGEEKVFEDIVTEVASKGCFVSAFDPPEDDLGIYYPYRDLGRTWFTAPPRSRRQEQEASL